MMKSRQKFFDRRSLNISKFSNKFPMRSVLNNKKTTPIVKYQEKISKNKRKKIRDQIAREIYQPKVRYLS